MNYSPVAEIIAIANSLDRNLGEGLSDSFMRLGWALSHENLSYETKRKAILQLNSYLKKKADEFDPRVVVAHFASLRRIRNEVAHGKLPREMDLSAYYPMLWRAISRLAERTGPYEIENLLAYTLWVENRQRAQNGASPTAVVRSYKKFFDSFDEHRKQNVFVELLLRLFSDNSSLSLLDDESKS